MQPAFAGPHDTLSQEASAMNFSYFILDQQPLPLSWEYSLDPWLPIGFSFTTGWDYNISSPLEAMFTPPNKIGRVGFYYTHLAEDETETNYQLSNWPTLVSSI